VPSWRTFLSTVVTLKVLAPVTIPYSLTLKPGTSIVALSVMFSSALSEYPPKKLSLSKYLSAHNFFALESQYKKLPSSIGIFTKAEL
jgi:hypothetical protein